MAKHLYHIYIHTYIQRITKHAKVEKSYKHGQYIDFNLLSIHPDLKVGPVYEAVCEYLVVVGVGRPRHSEVRDTRISCESRNQLRGPVGRHDLRVIIHLGRDRLKG